MKLSKEFSYKNLDGIFSTILLIHGRIMKKHLSEFTKDNLMKSMIVKLRKNRFLQQPQKIELIN